MKFLTQREAFNLAQFPFCGKEIALIGAGPSLNLWKEKIKNLEKRALFLLADVVALGFLKEFSPEKCLVFSVEKKRHIYLQNLSKNIPLAVYWDINWRNVPKENPVYVFSLVGEKVPFLPLVSPGTVMGLAMAYALYLLQKEAGGVLHIFGLDFCFLEKQVYSRFVEPCGYSVNRFESWEKQELIRYYKRGDVLISLNGFLLRTSREFWQSRENLIKLLKTVSFAMEVYHYSPLPLPFSFVKQVSPF